MVNYFCCSAVCDHCNHWWRVACIWWGATLFALNFLRSFNQVQFRALEIADRTTFGFLRVLTIPLLLLVDVALGYTLTLVQFVGVSLITLSLVFMFLGKRISRKGVALSLFSAVNAVITISIYKYDITNFRSVAVEGMYITAILFCYFALRSFILHGSGMFRTLYRKDVAYLAGGNGVAAVLVSFAYQYGPASLILAMVRAGSLFWSFIFGAIYFGEVGVRRKFAVLSLLVVAILLIVK